MSRNAITHPHLSILMPTRAVFLPVVFALMLGLASCAPDRPAEPADDAAPATPDAVDANGVRTVTITPVGNEMRFEQTEIRATAGETIRVVMNNTATSPAMHHNVLFLDDRESIDTVGRAAMEAGDRGYIPDHPAVLGSTPMAAPGETTEFEFTVPNEAGEYPYICTYPGHYVMMQGTLFVSE
jgi:azurin